MRTVRGLVSKSAVLAVGLGVMGFAGAPAATAQTGGLRWWGWLLIVVAIIVLACLICWCLRNRRSRAAAAARAEAAAPAASAAVHEPEIAAPVEAVEAEVAEPVRPDDLKKIEGIGPKVASLLADDGILTFAQLAGADVSRVRQVLEAAKLPMIDPSSWAEQAALAADGLWDDLGALQDALKGGRHTS